MKILRKCLASVLIFAVILGMCMPCSLTADAYAFTPPFTINSKA